MIQKQYSYSDRELLGQITEDLYYQYYIGLLGFVSEPSFVSSLLVEFRKRLDGDIMIEINEMFIVYNMPDDLGPGDGGNSTDDTLPESKNSGTIILDAICAKQNISYPQDVNLLNEARENIEVLIDKIYYDYHYYTPCMYR